MVKNLNRQISLDSAQLDLLLKASIPALFSSFILSIAVAYLQWEVIANSIIIGWLICIQAVVILRAILLIKFFRTPVTDEVSIHLRVLTMRVFIILAGAIWGSAGFLLFPENDAYHQMVVAFSLFGTALAGVSSYSTDYTAAVIYSILNVMPIAVRLLLEGTDVSTIMGLGTFLYLAFIIFTLKINGNSQKDNIRGRLEAQDREEEIRISEERYRLLLNHIPTGVFHYDNNLVITYCNTAFSNVLNIELEKLMGLPLYSIYDSTVIATLRQALIGQVGYFEGYYTANVTETEGWGMIITTPSKNVEDKIVGGVGIIQDTTEHKTAEDKIKKLAFYDPVTGLPNRRLLRQRLEKALVTSKANGSKGALLFLDIDKFKDLNDTLGHDIGDLLLKQVAERLVDCTSKNDTVSRIGGDEYVILLEDLGNDSDNAISQIMFTANRMLSKLNQPYILASHEYQSTSSIGVTVFLDHGKSEDELLKYADIAMYQAKRNGRNTLQFFDPSMQDVITLRTTLEIDLRKALAQNQLSLSFQAQVHNDSGLIGAEVLVRWLHPKLGDLSPTQFIPIAEDTGLILSIGDWMLESACKQLQKWQENAVTNHLSISVNVSAKQFHHPQFANKIQSLLLRYKVNPSLLKLELTESMLLNQEGKIILTMNTLNEVGIKFTLDDFGTGYSSLQYLKNLPLSQLKIDRAFVRDIAENKQDQAIAHTIVTLANALHLNVVAEGVETEAQKLVLMKLGCYTFQGHLLGKAMSIEHFNDTWHAELVN